MAYRTPCHAGFQTPAAGRMRSEAEEIQRSAGVCPRSVVSEDKLFRSMRGIPAKNYVAVFWMAIEGGNSALSAMPASVLML
jgi:hypothetical protein